MAFAGSVSLKVAASESKSGVTLGNASWAGNFNLDQSFVNGTGASQWMLKSWQESR